MTTAGYTQVSLKIETRELIRTALVAYTTAAGRRLYISELISAALAVAARHHDELMTALER